MRMVLLLVVAVVMAGCVAPTLVSPEQAQPVPPERIYALTQPGEARTAAVQITRGAASAGLWGEPSDLRVLIDGELTAVIGKLQTMRVWVSPGFHIATVRAGDTGGSSTQFHAAADGVTCLRIAIGIAVDKLIQPSAVCPAR